MVPVAVAAAALWKQKGGAKVKREREREEGTGALSTGQTGDWMAKQRDDERFQLTTENRGAHIATKNKTISPSASPSDKSLARRSPV